MQISIKRDFGFLRDKSTYNSCCQIHMFVHCFHGRLAYACIAVCTLKLNCIQETGCSCILMAMFQFMASSMCILILLILVLTFGDCLLTLFGCALDFFASKYEEKKMQSFHFVVSTRRESTMSNAKPITQLVFIIS